MGKKRKHIHAERRKVTTYSYFFRGRSQESSLNLTTTITAYLHFFVVKHIFFLIINPQRLFVHTHTHILLYPPFTVSQHLPNPSIIYLIPEFLLTITNYLPCKSLASNSCNRSTESKYIKLLSIKLFSYCSPFTALCYILLLLPFKHYTMEIHANHHRTIFMGHIKINNNNKNTKYIVNLLLHLTTQHSQFKYQLQLKFILPRQNYSIAKPHALSCLFFSWTIHSIQRIETGYAYIPMLQRCQLISDCRSILNSFTMPNDLRCALKPRLRIRLVICLDYKCLQWVL